jgi:hypothetical protein
MGRINLDVLYRRIQLDKSAASKSLAWFDEKIRYMKNSVSPNSLMANPQRTRGVIVPGYMYLFYYKPVGINELPYYDTFPLVIPFSEDAETFTGINFHYLPPKVRAVLLKNLLDFATDNKLKETSRLKFQWAFIRGASRYPGVEHAVKKYRKDHVTSSFLFIPANQWFNAIMLPVEKFSTGSGMSAYSKQNVWRNTIGYS